MRDQGQTQHDVAMLHHTILKATGIATDAVQAAVERQPKLANFLSRLRTVLGVFHWWLITTPFAATLITRHYHLFPRRMLVAQVREFHVFGVRIGSWTLSRELYKYEPPEQAPADDQAEPEPQVTVRTPATHGWMKVPSEDVDET